MCLNLYTFFLAGNTILDLHTINDLSWSQLPRFLPYCTKRTKDKVLSGNMYKKNPIGKYQDLVRIDIEF